MPDSAPPSEYQSALQFLARAVGVTADYGAAAERAGAQLAGFRLPAADLDVVARMTDDAYTVAQQAATAYTGLIAAHRRIAETVTAVGGAPDRMSWYGQRR